MDKDKNIAVIGQIPEKLSQRRKIPKLPLIVIAVIIGLGGAYAVIRSLADTATVPGAGHISFIRDATSSFDNYTANATSTQQQWMDQHYSRMRGYSPFFDQALGWAPPTDFYRDLYAIYTTDTSTISQHPDWILKDGSGQKLYIPSGCDGTTCPQYAGDIGNADFRQAWIDKAKTDLAKGYKGIFIDDVDISIHTSNASGTAVTPMDPRTGQPMTSAAWGNYIAEFTEEIRSQLPNAYLEHNAVWSESQSDPSVQREIQSADVIELERGFNDSGLTGGTGTYGYETFLSHVDWLHSLGKSVIDEPYLTTPTQREFEIASFFLVNNGTDYLTSSYQADPDNWWPGWSTDLGAAHGPRYSWNGFLRRDFDKGFVLTNEPGATTRTVSLGGSYTRLDDTTASSVQLAAREGAVLFNPTSSSSADTTAPTVSLTAPVSGGTVSGSSVAVSANASDDTGVAGVQFKLDGNNLGSEDTSSPYGTTWDTTKATNGSHTLTAVARDAAGNTKTSSSITVTVNNSTGGGSSGSCTTTLNVGANVQNALSSAAPGAVICLSAGTWSAQTFSGVAPTGTVTLQPVPGAAVHIKGITLNGPGNIKNLTVKGFYIDGGVQGLCGIDGNVVFQSNTIQHINAGNAFYFYANGCGGSHVQTGVSMLNNQMDHVGECLTVAGGASIEKNFTFKNNVCGPDIGAGVTKGNQYSHYIEIGCMAGGTFDNNAFLGPYDATALSNTDTATAVHNNVFHCFGDGSNISFSNNILWHTQSRAQTVLVQSGKMDNITIHNNLFVNDPFCHTTSNNCPAQDIEVYATHGLNVTNNTISTTAWGLHFPSVCTDGCYASGTDETLTNNIVESAATEGNADYSEWGCASVCVTGNNVSYDSSAVGTPSVKNWTPSYTNTTWTPHDGEPYSPPPSGYYVAKGLPFSAGWNGVGGPQGDVGALNGSSDPGTTPPADTTKPTVSIASPANNATVSSIVTAAAAASDNVGVTKVDFYLDDAISPAISDSSSPYNYSFDSKTLNNGSHTVTAKAYDAAGNTSSATVTVTVSNPDITPPSAPTNVKATAANATTVNLTWSASTDSGTNATGVAKYNVLRNGVVIAQPTTTSYTDTTAVANTSYSYVIQAVDGAGNVSANSTTATVKTPDVSSGQQGCVPDLTHLITPGCTVLKSDTVTSGSDSVIEGLWGDQIQCASPSRVQVPATGGDPHDTASGAPQGNTSYYQMQVLDGDDFYGSRCELGQNERRYGENGGAGTFQLYQQGQHKITLVSIKLPTGFQSNENMWQTILQMKQTEPDNTAGSSPILELQEYGNKFRIESDPAGELWTTNAVVGQWVRFAFDVTYSQNNDGKLKVYVDLNGDGDTLDPGEQSPVITTATLATQTQTSTGAGPLLYAGDPVPGHLRMGLYHNPSYSCPAPNGCTIDDDNVQVVDASNAQASGDAPDTTPPTTPTNVKAAAASATQVNLTWDASTDSGGSGLAGYNIYRNGSKLNSSPVVTTSYGDSTLSASTTYTYKIEAIDGAGNKSPQTSETNVTTPAAPDTTAPTVSITAPANNGTVSGSSVIVSANAADDKGVAGVQFKLDGNNLNAEVTTTPYTIAWDTTTAANGTHMLTATARDAAGNTKTSASVTITVSNSAGVPGISLARTAVAGNPDFSNVNQDATHYQFVVTQSWKTNELNALKAANPNIKVLAYYNLTGMSYPSGGQYSGCVDPTNAPESYFLHNQNGQRFTFGDYTYIWAANQGDSAYQQSCANHIISDLTSKGFDGVMLDDTNYSIKYHYTPSQVKEYPTDAQYGAATKSAVAYIGPRVQAAGKLIIPNMGGTYAENADFNDSLLQYVSGAYDEFFVSWPGGTLQPDSDRTRAMQSIATAESIGKYYVANTVGTSAGDTKTALYGLASSMLVSGRYTSFGFSAGDYSTDIWLPIFDTAKSLGTPAGDYYMTGSVQRRNFTKGAVLVNPTTSTQTVSLGGTFTGSGLTNVTNVSMPAQTGLILQASSSLTDTTKPTVSITAPTSGATVSGTVTATANASDNVGVTKVEISLDGSLKMTDTSSPYNYSFDSKTLSNGTHTISARAYDAAGNASTTSITVNVNNADTAPPSAPTNVKATAANAITVNLTWDASTDASGITKYNVLRNGVVIAQPTTTSYTDTTAVANTAYSYVIQAVDGAGNISANSSAVTVTTPKAATTDQDLLFNGTKISDYSNQSALGAVTEVPDPAGSSQTVFKMVVKNTDVAPVTPTDNPRAQLVSPGVIQQGSTFWLSTKIYVPGDFPSVPSSGWFCGLQVYGEPYGGTPPWSVCFTGNNIDWSRNATYRDQPWEMPLPKNQWVSIVLHEKLASDGFVEMWVNGQQVTFFNGNTDNPNHISPTTHLTMQTADASNNGSPNTGDLQSYRMVDMFDTVTLYEWPMKIGATQVSVQDSSDGGAPQPDTTPPTTPTNVKATAASATQVNLTWDASTDSGGSGLAGYNVYRDGTKLNSSPVTSTSYGDSTVNDSTKYTYKIEAVDGAGNKSAQSTGASVTTPAAPDTTPPTTPTNVKATAASATQVNLTWKASTDSGGSGLAGYNVYRDGTQLNTAPLTTTSYNDANVQASTTYQYDVQAVDRAGNTSDRTGTVSVTTPAATTGGKTTGNSGGKSSNNGHGSGSSSGSNGSHSDAHRYPVTIQVYDRHHQPANQAQVSLYDQTAQTDHHGQAHFKSIPSGKHDVLVSYGGQSVQHTVTVKNNSSNKSKKSQIIKFSLTGSNLSPALLLVPVVALVAGGLIIFRPWNSRLSRAAAGAAPEDRIVSSNHPSDAPMTQPGRLLETPGTVYKPTDHDDSSKS